MAKLYWRYRFWRASHSRNFVYSKYTIPVGLLLATVLMLLPCSGLVKFLLYIPSMFWYSSFCRHESAVCSKDPKEFQSLKLADWLAEAIVRNDFIHGKGDWEGDA